MALKRRPVSCRIKLDRNLESTSASLSTFLSGSLALWLSGSLALWLSPLCPLPRLLSKREVQSHWFGQFILRNYLGKRLSSCTYFSLKTRFLTAFINGQVLEQIAQSDRGYPQDPT